MYVPEVNVVERIKFPLLSEMDEYFESLIVTVTPASGTPDSLVTFPLNSD